jgi:UDPglucose 6-dehydrogenase
MRIGIVGFGFVGQAISWAHRNDQLVICDPKLEDSVELTKFLNCDAIFVCVPSPSTADGHCDTSILEQVLKELQVVTNNQIPIICKTTAPPTVYNRLQIIYPNIVHCPEFLTAANATEDYCNQDYCIIGGDYYWGVKARIVISHGRPMDLEKFIIVSIKTAALYKYMMNCYLATKVTFMNDFKKIADVTEVKWADLTYLASYDHRIGQTHMSVPGPDGKYGWGGACFPKDVAAIIKEATDLNVDCSTISMIEMINKIHRQ